MKNLFLLAVISLCVFACKNAETHSAEVAKTDEAAATAFVYPYSTKKPYRDWEIGSQNNSVIAMSGLKAFETGDIPGTLSYFADSCEMVFNDYNEKLDRKALEKFFIDERARYASVKIVMQDWMSVISKDKTEEWVTMWYKQINTMKDGKVDSVNVVNDLKIEKGKVVILDEKSQKIPVKKK